jgi:8-oxo-dGTP diphosphatase
VTLVRAAGGLIAREGPKGLEVVLVHRPAYGDWSFPKGKLEPGEDEPSTALREVKEETGLSCELTDDLGAITYVDGRGRPKVVRYWRMVAPPGAEPAASHEVDDARWVPVPVAEPMLTYPHDRTLLRRLTGEPSSGEAVPVYVIRHTKAGERQGWNEPDELRPMSKTGRKQAAKLVASLEHVPFTRFVSSPYLRCLQTMDLFTDRWGIDVDLAPELAEDQPWEFAEAWVIAAAADGPAALCTHGDIMQDLIEGLLARGVPLGGDDEVGYRKGTAWRLDVRDGRIIRASYRPPVS